MVIICFFHSKRSVGYLYAKPDTCVTKRYYVNRVDVVYLKINILFRVFPELFGCFVATKHTHAHTM